MALEAYANQEVPFEKLVDELQPERSLSHAPLFQVMFVLQNAPRTDFTLRGLTVTRMRTETNTSKFDLTLYATESTGNLTLAFEYNADLFDDARIERMLEHLRILLEGVVRSPEARIRSLEILTKAERERLLVHWNDTAADFRINCIHELFEEQVTRTPKEIAVISEADRLTYEELNRRANQLAHYLKARGVGPEVLVGICIERSLEMVVGLLGILKAGGAYLPLDPAYPSERLAFMLRDSEVPVLLTQAGLVNRLPAHDAELIRLDGDWDRIGQQSGENVAHGPVPENAVYAIYTSGSTGQPKGAINTHAGICNRLLWMQEQYQLTGSDRVLQKTPFSFDVSVWEFFWPLLTGATLVMARPGGHQDSRYLTDLIVEQKITTLHFVPSMLRVFLQEPLVEKCGSLRRVIASGEELPFDLQKQFFDRLPSVELHNLYGPTEAAVDVTYWACEQNSKNDVVPIGRPIANTKIYILDKYLYPVPVGVPGELHIGGVGLARGYLKRPALTGEKFISDAFSGEAASRLYKTGDLARFLEDGNIEYLGRIDNQVKLRGFRIELGEIEGVIKTHPGVSEALVLVREDEPGDQRLTAYVIPNRATSDPATNGDMLQVTAKSLEPELKTVLAQQLPEYMRPSEFIFLYAFPLTPNGKVDRSALPRPSQSRPELVGLYAAPRNDVEEQLAKIWAGILKRERVGVNDNFFELGGHSLLATQVLSRIREHLKVELPLRKMFELPTIAGLATEVVELRQGPKPPPVPAIRRRTRGAAKVEQLSPEEVDSLLSKVLSESDLTQ